jgi:hypothetical protein
MSGWVPMIGDLEIDDVMGNLHRMDASSRDAILIFGAMAVVTLLVVVWAAFIRKKPRKRLHHYRRPQVSRAAEPETAEEPEQPAEEPGGGRRRKRRRREHRPRNPTLAETGGLPPIKPEGSNDLLP